jgi:hypothetical protein
VVRALEPTKDGAAHNGMVGGREPQKGGLGLAEPEGTSGERFTVPAFGTHRPG